MLPRFAERRGRALLGSAILLIGGALLSSLLSDMPQTSEEWIELLFGSGPLFLVLCFAFRGGSFSLAAIKFVLLLFGSILLLVAVLAVFAPPGADVPSLTVFVSWRGLCLLFCYTFLFWTFFLSSSVRVYLQHRRELAPGPSLR